MTLDPIEFKSKGYKREHTIKVNLTYKSFMGPEITLNLTILDLLRIIRMIQYSYRNSYYAYKLREFVDYVSDKENFQIDYNAPLPRISIMEDRFRKK